MNVGTDAYASIADVSAYLLARGTDTAWLGASTIQQNAAIVEATSFMDAAFAWVGRIEDDTQPLGWPRVSAYDKEGRLLEDIPTPVKNACAELANLALGGRLMPMSLSSGSTGIKSERIGDVQIDYETSSYTATYDYVRLILRGIGGMRSGNSGINRLVRA